MNLANIKEGLSEGTPDEIADLIIKIGKNGLVEFEKDIASFLKHTDLEIRADAIRVLGFYWHLPEYKDIAYNMLINDEEPWVRSVALMSWARYFRNSNDKKILLFLLSILKNEEEDYLVRSEAYQGILVVSLLQPKEWPKTSVDDIDKDVNWELVNKIISEAH